MDGIIIPEKDKTLELQAEALMAGRLDAMLVTPGGTVPVVTDPFTRLPSKIGVWLYNPYEYDEETILSVVEDGSYYKILGHLEPKSEKATYCVVAFIDEVEAKFSLTSYKNLRAQSEILAAQFPSCYLKIGGDELINYVVNERLLAQNSFVEKLYAFYNLKKDLEDKEGWGM